MFLAAAVGVVVAVVVKPAGEITDNRRGLRLCPSEPGRASPPSKTPNIHLLSSRCDPCLSLAAASLSRAWSFLFTVRDRFSRDILETFNDALRSRLGEAVVIVLPHFRGARSERAPGCSLQVRDERNGAASEPLIMHHNIAREER
jgi:hypothetical protein